MESILVDLSKKTLLESDYEFIQNPPPDLVLTDYVVCYSDGYDTKIIPLDIMKRFPLLHDRQKSLKKAITLAVCPFTLASCVYEGLFKPTQSVDRSCLIITNYDDRDENQVQFNIIQGHYTIKRYEVSIKTLRNAFTDHIHGKYLILKNKSNSPILMDSISKNYYTSEKLVYDQDQEPLPKSQPFTKEHQVFSNKKLVYLILYESSVTHEIKSTVLADPSTPEGGIYNNNKTQYYLEKNIDKINEKAGFVIPLLWFSWRAFYPDSKILLL